MSCKYRCRHIVLSACQCSRFVALVRQGMPAGAETTTGPSELVPKPVYTVCPISHSGSSFRTGILVLALPTRFAGQGVCCGKARLFKGLHVLSNGLGLIFSQTRDSLFVRRFAAGFAFGDVFCNLVDFP